VIGLTVVALGTSAPEMAVTLMSALSGQADIAFGNAIGSSTCNVLLILGSSASIMPLMVERTLLRVDVPIMIAAALFMALMASDGLLSRADGLIFLAGLSAYILLSIRLESRAAAAAPARSAPAAPASIPWCLTLIAAGLVMLVTGSRWLVIGAVDLARALGISELVIGLTIVAVGTSLPELATSIMAAIRKEREIAVGNVVGSNIFNILGVLGIAGAFSPEGIHVAPAAMEFDVPVMIAVFCACLPIFFTDYCISRLEGGLLLLYYVAYTTFLILDARSHVALPTFAWVMLTLVLPFTALVLVLDTLRSLVRARHGAGGS
jgi:cation:H+ antiporter